MNLLFKKGAFFAFLLLNSVMARAEDDYVIRVPVQAAVHSPEIVNFDLGTVVIGAEPRVSTFFVNKGAEPTQVELVQTSGRARVIVNECLGQTLAPNATCKLDMSLISNTLGDISGSVTVYHTKAQAPNIYNMTAKVINTAEVVRFDEALINFGTQTVKTSATRVATLRNTGSEPVFLMDIGFLRATSNFKILNTNCLDSELAPGGSCTVAIEFKPNLGGNTSAQIYYELEDGSKITSLTVQGQGAFAALTWGSSGLVFENVPVGQISEAKPVTIINSGSGAMGITSLKIMEAGIESPNFKVKTSFCPSFLNASQSCVVEVDFRSQTEGDKFAVLEATVSGATSPVYRLQMAAKTVSQKPAFEFVPVAVNFSNVAFGSNSVLPLTIRSTGQVPLVVSSYGLTGPDSAQFSTQANSCIGSLDPGMECTFNVSLNASKAGANTALLNLTSNVTEPFSGVPLTANVVRGILNVDPGFVVFDSTEIGQTRTQVLTFNNPSPYGLNITSISITDSNNFSITGNCVGPLAAGASCQTTLTYAPKSAQNHASSVKVLSNSTSPDLTVAVSGRGLNPPEPAVSLTTFECNNPIQVASCSTFGCQPSNVTCQATMTNTGAVNIPAISATISNAQFRASGCTSLNVGQSCTVTLQGISSTLGAQSVTYSTTIGGQAYNRVASFNVSEPSLDLTTNNHTLVFAGQSNTASHTLRNNGLFAVSVSTISATNTSAITVSSRNCPATLNPNQSCQITTTCSNNSPATYSTDINVQSFKLVSKPVSCTVSAAPAQAGQIALTPNPVNFGTLKVGQSTSSLMTLTNNNASNTSAATLGAVVISGPNAAEFTATKESCTTSLAPGQSCTIRVNHTPTSVGVKQAQVSIAAGPGSASATLSSNAAVASLSLSPTSLNLGNTNVGQTSSTLQATLSNNGPVSARILSLTPQGSPDFTRSGTCAANLELAPSQSCTIRYSSTSSTAGSKTGSLVIAVSDSIPSLTLNLSANVLTPLTFTSTSSLNCPASAPANSTYTCQAQISSTGTGALNISSANASQVAGPGATRSLTTGSWTCTAGSTISAIAPGATCQAPVSVPATSAGNYTIEIRPSSNGSVPAAQATTSVQGASVSLTTTDHPTTARSVASTATHTLSNSGLASASITSITSSNAAITVSNSCSSLASGQSCTFTTSCLSSTAQQITATLTATGNFGSVAKPVNCSVQAPSLLVERLTPLSNQVPAYTNSGNWIRITNNGAGSIVTTGFTAAPGWTLFRNSADATHCSTSRALQAGQSCFVLESLNGSQAKNITVAGNHTISSNVLSPLTVAASPLTTRGINLAQITAFAPVQVSGQTQAVYRATNEAPATLSSLSASITGTGYAIVANTCSTSLAPNQSCDITVRFTAPSTTSTTSGTLNVLGGYPAVINNEVQAGAATARSQASATMSNTAVAARVSLTAGVFNSIEVGQTLEVAHVLRNEGVGSVNLTGNPSLSSVGQHTIVGGTCSSGSTLASNGTCTIVTRFAPTTPSQTTVTLSIPTSVGTASTPLVGRVLPAADLAVSVTAPSGLLRNSTGTHSLTVRNNGASRVTALVNFGTINAGGAQSFLKSISSPVCGTQTFNSSGALVSSTPGTATSTISCTVSANGRDLLLSMSGSAVFSASAVVEAGSELGSYTYSLVGTLQDATELNNANNQATGSVPISNPFADLAVTIQASSSSYTFNWPDGFITLTLRNLSSGTTAADLANGQFNLVASSASNSATATLGAPVCVSASAGSTCQANGSVTLAKGGSVQVRYPLTTGSVLGNVLLTASLANTSSDTSDTNQANNTASTTITISDLAVAKLCMFNTFKQGAYLGQDQFNELENKSNDGNGWASVNYPNPTRSTDNPFTGFVSLRSWLRWHLFDGWEQLTHNVPGQQYTGVTKWYLDPLKAVWKGTTKPVQTKFDSGNRFWFIDKPPVPVILYSNNGTWYMHFTNWDSTGNFYGAILGYSDYSNDYGTNGSVTPLGGNYIYFWRPYKDNNFSRAWKNAKSEGFTSQGQFLKQGWIETSPGGNCIVPGTSLVSRQNLPAINPAAYSQ